MPSQPSGLVRNKPALNTFESYRTYEPSAALPNQPRRVPRQRIAASLNGLPRFSRDTVCAAVHRRFSIRGAKQFNQGRASQGRLRSEFPQRGSPLCRKDSRTPVKGTKRCGVDLVLSFVGIIRIRICVQIPYRCQNCNENHRTDKRRKILALRVFQTWFPPTSSRTLPK